MQTKLEPTNQSHRILILVLTIFLTAGAVGGGVYYVMNQQVNNQGELIDKLGNETTLPGGKTTETKEEVKFAKVKINGVDVSLPENWKIGSVEKTEEDIDGNEENPFPIYKGESFWNFSENGKDDRTYIGVNDMSSYEKDSNLKGEVDILKKVYSDKTLEEGLLKSNVSSYLPPINAATISYNHKYIESPNAKWRGYWYLANQGQGVDADIYFISILYNKESDKVLTINHAIKSGQSKELNEKMGNVNDWNNKFSEEIEEYMKTAYSKDKEVKETVDRECLEIIKRLI